MRDKVLYSVSSLKNWSDKILNDVGREERRLQSFILDFNIRDYFRFYGELLPFLEERAAKDPERFSSYLETYKANKVLLEEGMRENAVAEVASTWFFGLPVMRRKANDLVAAIREVRANTGNIETSMNLDL